MRLLLLISTLLTFAASPALAQGWDSYANVRFGYAVDVPPGYVGEGEADNGDGQVFSSADGTQLMRVHGGNALDGFEATVASVMEEARAGGWNLSYERTTPSWASFSGTRNGIILYARAIALCGGTQFASFELRYPERDLEPMNAVVERLVDSLREAGDATC